MLHPLCSLRPSSVLYFVVLSSFMIAIVMRSFFTTPAMVGVHQSTGSKPHSSVRMNVVIPPP